MSTDFEFIASPPSRPGRSRQNCWFVGRPALSAELPLTADERECSTHKSSQSTSQARAEAANESARPDLFLVLGSARWRAAGETAAQTRGNTKPGPDTAAPLSEVTRRRRVLGGAGRGLVAAWAPRRRLVGRAI